MYNVYQEEIMKDILKDTIKTAGVLIACYSVCLIIERFFKASSLVTAVMALAVFIVSRMTTGYVYGLVASLVSVLALNYAFSFPYFAFNFSIPENVISAIIMLAITFMTSALTSQLKQQERMRAESEKEKMRGNLLRAVSHDLRTPLTTIYGSSTAICENYDQLSDQQKLQLVSDIKEDANWLMKMVENILSITRIDNAKVNIAKSSTSLEELIDSVLIKFKKQYPGQKVVVKMPDEYVSVLMDALLIEQVLMNLLENAVLHAKGMTMLILQVTARSTKVIFEVKDDGCGIDSSRLPGLFKDYFEVGKAPVDHQKRSMGIGLAVCASIIKAHGGEIMAENGKEGGCCFRFTLDREVTEDES